jgi:hypothetical protein
VAPICHPEVAARAAVFAADHAGRREHWVGLSTASTLTLSANALVPGFLDRYLDRSGIAAQKTGRPKGPDQPANLWEPVDGPAGRDFGTHGAFDSRAHDHSRQQWLAQHYGQRAAAAGLDALLGRQVWR